MEGDAIDSAYAAVGGFGSKRAQGGPFGQVAGSALGMLGFVGLYDLIGRLIRQFSGDGVGLEAHHILPALERFPSRGFYFFAVRVIIAVLHVIGGPIRIEGLAVVMEREGVPGFVFGQQVEPGLSGEWGPKA